MRPTPNSTRRSILGGAAAIVALLGARRVDAAPTDDDIVEAVEKLNASLMARSGCKWEYLIQGSMICLVQRGGEA